jgi:hypothetical protein
MTAWVLGQTGNRPRRQDEDYYVLRVGEVQVTLANLDAIERATSSWCG